MGHIFASFYLGLTKQHGDDSTLNYLYIIIFAPVYDITFSYHYEKMEQGMSKNEALKYATLRKDGAAFSFAWWWYFYHSQCFPTFFRLALFGQVMKFCGTAQTSTTFFFLEKTLLPHLR